MATLNQSFLNGIRERLTERGISPNDFLITQEQSGSTLTLTIKYLYDDKFFYNATIEDYGSNITGQYSPGKIISNEYEYDMNSNDFLKSVRNWIVTLRNEMQNTTIGREVQETQEKLAELENFVQEKFKENTETYFTKQEGNELKEKLNKLEELYKEAIANNEEDNYKINQEHKQLHAEVQLLKEQVEYLSKKKWATAIMIKMMNWASRNPVAAKQIGQAAMKTVLPPEIQESIPSLLPPSDEQ